MQIGTKKTEKVVEAAMMMMVAIPKAMKGSIALKMI